MASRSEPLRSLTLLDVSDLELLHLIEDYASREDGYTSTADIAEALAIDTDVPNRTVGVRLSQMRWRYGWLEKHPDQKGRWMLSPMGQIMIDGGDLQASMTKALEKMNPAQRLRAMRMMGQDAASGPMEIRQALRREWNRNIGGR